jgi:hypothetical protein
LNLDNYYTKSKRRKLNFEDAPSEEGDYEYKDFDMESILIQINQEVKKEKIFHSLN